VTSVFDIPANVGQVHQQGRPGIFYGLSREGNYYSSSIKASPPTGKCRTVTLKLLCTSEIHGVGTASPDPLLKSVPPVPHLDHLGTAGAN
jgi:hypothetical protein